MRTMLRTFLLFVFTAYVMLAGQAFAGNGFGQLQQENPQRVSSQILTKTNPEWKGRVYTDVVKTTARCCMDQVMSKISTVRHCSVDFGLGLLCYGLNIPVVNILSAGTSADTVIAGIAGTVFRPPIS